MGDNLAPTRFQIQKTKQTPASIGRGFLLRVLQNQPLRPVM